MRVTVKLFAIMRERAGVDEITLDDLPAGATVGTVRDLLSRRFPNAADILPRVACAVNLSYAPIERKLEDGDEVAVIPPVSGG